MIRVIENLNINDTIGCSTTLFGHSAGKGVSVAARTCGGGSRPSSTGGGAACDRRVRAVAGAPSIGSIVIAIITRCGQFDFLAGINGKRTARTVISSTVRLDSDRRGGNFFSCNCEYCTYRHLTFFTSNRQSFMILISTIRERISDVTISFVTCIKIGTCITKRFILDELKADGGGTTNVKRVVVQFDGSNGITESSACTYNLNRCI